MMVVHAYFNIWCEAKTGKKKIEGTPNGKKIRHKNSSQKFITKLRHKNSSNKFDEKIH